MSDLIEFVKERIDEGEMRLNMAIVMVGSMDSLEKKQRFGIDNNEEDVLAYFQHNLAHIERQRRLFRESCEAIERERIHLQKRATQAEYPLAEYSLRLLAMEFAEKPEYREEFGL